MARAALRLSRMSTAIAVALAAAPLSAFAQVDGWGKPADLMDVGISTDSWVQTSAIQWSVQAMDWNATGSTYSPPSRGPGTLSSSGKPAVAKEMDRPSSKLAQFAINGNSPGPCRVGTRYPTLRLNDGSNRWQLNDVAVVGCGDGGMTVSYKSRQAR